MAVHLRVDPDALRDVGGMIAAAPEGSATPPPADITSPANDSVSTVASHGISAAIAGLGAHSVLAGTITGAASRLVAATADTYDDQELVNHQAMHLGGEPTSGPVVAPQMPPLTAPAAPTITPPTVGAPPTDGKQIAQLIHGGPGTSSWLAAADGLDTHAGHLRDASGQLKSAVAAMTGVWDSGASPHAESFLNRLAADYGRHADNTVAAARAVRTQADYFQQLKHEVPTPQEFDDMERRLRAADAANRQSRGRT